VTIINIIINTVQLSRLQYTMSKRARKPTKRFVASEEQKANRSRTQGSTQKKLSKKKRVANDSDSSSEEEHPPKKRRRQPDLVDIVEDEEEESEVEIEEVDEGSGGEENEDEVEDEADDDDEGDGLQEQHHADIPAHAKVKRDTTKDLRVVFGERVSVTFKKKGGGAETLMGRWCNVCR
jgi:hypothetical protein